MRTITAADTTEAAAIVEDDEVVTAQAGARVDAWGGTTNALKGSNVWVWSSQATVNRQRGAEVKDRTHGKATIVEVGG